MSKKKKKEKKIRWNIIYNIYNIITFKSLEKEKEKKN